jgi:hypothetical protein
VFSVPLGKGAGQLGHVVTRLCRLADEGKPLVVPHYSGRGAL